MDLMDIRRTMMGVIAQMTTSRANESTGKITISENTKTLTFNHGLSELPTIIEIYTPDPTESGSSPVGFRSIIASFICALHSGVKNINGIGYNSSGNRASLIETYFTVTIDSTTVTIVTTAAYNFVSGKEYTWRAIV